MPQLLGSHDKSRAPETIAFAEAISTLRHIFGETLQEDDLEQLEEISGLRKYKPHKAIWTRIRIALYKRKELTLPENITDDNLAMLKEQFSCP